MTLKLGINGFGRIGRNVLRQALKYKDIDVVAVNDLSDAHMLAHLLKYDSIHGILEKEVTTEESNLVVVGKEINILSEYNPANLNWGSLGVDIVIESTGHFTKREDAKRHLDAGAEKVIISAPAEEENLMIVMGG